MIHPVDKDYHLYRLSKLSMLMECVLQVVLIQAPPSLGQTELCGGVVSCPAPFLRPLRKGSGQQLVNSWLCDVMVTRSISRNDNYSYLAQQNSARIHDIAKGRDTCISSYGESTTVMVLHLLSDCYPWLWKAPYLKFY